MPEPMTAERLAEIRASVERANTEIGEVCAEGPIYRFRMSVPANPGRDTDLIISDALKGAEDLLAEVSRLNAYLNTINRLNEVADADWQSEVDRLKSTARTQAAMISEITSTCMAVEQERDRLKAQVELMGNHLQRESLDAIDNALAAAEQNGGGSDA